MTEMAASQAVALAEIKVDLVAAIYGKNDKIDKFRCPDLGPF